MQSAVAGMKVKDQQSWARLCCGNSPPIMPGYFSCKSAYAMGKIHEGLQAPKSIEQQYRYNQVTGAKDMFSFS